MKAGRQRLFGRCRFLGPNMLLALCSSVHAARGSSPPNHRLFEPATRCMVCHNGLVTPKGEDVSLGRAWGPTMMANSARDPYWQAGVRREVLEHPTLGGTIQDECSKCHMPMATTAAHAAGQEGEVFRHLSDHDSAANVAETPLARDGVSCSLCHQIQPTHLGQRGSFVGGFVIDTQTEPGNRKEFGPYSVDRGRAHLMRSASHMSPTQATHLGASEMCATCHTLYTHALDANGKVVGELPEQVPYQEWLHSDFRTKQSCQTCHMPVAAGPLAVSSVAGQSRQRLHQHDFLGGNFFMQSLFSRFGSELFAEVAPADFQLAAERTREHLSHRGAALHLQCTQPLEGQLRVAVTVENRTGHKLPTAYPSRRVWLHVTVRSSRGTIVFESGALRDNGSIIGNDNDSNALRFEPHYTRIDQGSKVAIYESILGRPDGRVTTGLLNATHYLKDNRLLPRGFDKATAHVDVAVHGDALQDPNFQGGGDALVYEVALGEAPGPYAITVELLYQPIGFRWAENLRRFSEFEPRRFVQYYGALASRSATSLAVVQTVVK